MIDHGGIPEPPAAPARRKPIPPRADRGLLKYKQFYGRTLTRVSEVSCSV
jgi:hypothetical protein